ncbi:MAG: type II toxin-antitoxin system mRNA interferase toxin, RelE/StbE family [Sulfurimonas sp.]|uniref:type II toxin-antitoxin system RelE family toxin n=1 Tax=Sulfurimonas sp. TaxID=2022749 RepID=UPI00262A4257|nr:type II toxin-antitoxin system mRNA interferase toxin, RelE/StbE family [Sulfurimonas sp.]MCW8895183.1 type II toxin-antitoxin system mRNA interferase toxin, RelE/StbE family [Sulfurimonas sp.]MCW8954856.1 type II toxin-antitoxin system mRNA interferase toxin, RelE/StbE family [Sulfurimonas sp.]MCW9068451.1 type II toxin-antitoxin system mRNA interferase toxin, RelE/StbE family [Sulfurimonas sp.]
MYKIDFKPNVKKDFKNIDKSDIAFVRDSLYDFVKNFSSDYEKSLMHSGKIKKLKGQKEVLYRLKLRSYRVIYKKYDDKLLILVLHVTTRESAYK